MVNVRELEAYCSACSGLYERVSTQQCPAGPTHTWAVRRSAK